jgi:hypothetical protein
MHSVRILACLPEIGLCEWPGIPHPATLECRNACRSSCKVAITVIWFWPKNWNVSPNFIRTPQKQISWKSIHMFWSCFIHMHSYNRHSAVRSTDLKLLKVCKWFPTEFATALFISWQTSRWHSYSYAFIFWQLMSICWNLHLSTNW